VTLASLAIRYALSRFWICTGMPVSDRQPVVVADPLVSQSPARSRTAHVVSNRAMGETMRTTFRRGTSCRYSTRRHPSAVCDHCFGCVGWDRTANRHRQLKRNVQRRHDPSCADSCGCVSCSGDRRAHCRSSFPHPRTVRQPTQSQLLLSSRRMLPLTLTSNTYDVRVTGNSGGPVFPAEVQDPARWALHDGASSALLAESVDDRHATACPDRVHERSITGKRTPGTSLAFALSHEREPTLS